MPDEPLASLIEAAYRQTLARFDREVENGERDPQAEIGVYRRRRRDYESLLRMGDVPDEARELAARLLETHGLQPASRRQFEEDVGRLLIRLYAAFIERAGKPAGGSTPNSDQGSR
ncbi:MAG TPA: hypothetical protein VF254_04235 [Gammaproteobacteria bacterium]